MKFFSAVQPQEERNLKRKAEAPIDSDEEPEVHDEVRLWESGFKERYYESKFDVTSDNANFRRKVALEYVKGLCWVLKYYYQVRVNGKNRRSIFRNKVLLAKKITMFRSYRDALRGSGTSRIITLHLLRTSCKLPPNQWCFRKTRSRYGRIVFTRSKCIILKFFD